MEYIYAKKYLKYKYKYINLQNGGYTDINMKKQLKFFLPLIVAVPSTILLLNLLKNKKSTSNRSPSAVMPVMSNKGYFCIMRHGFRRDDPEHEEVKQDISFPPYDCPIINSKTIEILNSLKVFSTVSFDIIYTSPFKRCWQTALLIAKKFMPNTKIIVDYNLREKDSAIIKDSGQKIFPINITQLIPQDKLEKEIDKSELSIEYIQPLDKFIDITNDIYNEPNKIIERNNYIIRLQDSKLNILVITHGDFVGSYYKHLTKKTSYSMKYCGYVLSKNNKFINNENFESTIID